MFSTLNISNFGSLADSESLRKNKNKKKFKKDQKKKKKVYKAAKKTAQSSEHWNMLRRTRQWINSSSEEDSFPVVLKINEAFAVVFSAPT